MNKEADNDTNKIPPPPEGFRLYGKGPLPQDARSKTPSDDIWFFDSFLRKWVGNGLGMLPKGTYAIRIGTETERLCWPEEFAEKKPQDDGGTAFPFGQVSELTGQPINGCFSEGMSLRDWFAGMSLGHIPALLDACEKNKSMTLIAEWAYGVADAMLAERSKG